MTFTLSDATTRVALYVKDIAPFLTAGDDQLAIEAATQQLNKDKPLNIVSDIPGDGSQDYRLPVAFIKGMSDVKTVESPAGQTPVRMRPRNDDWFLYEDPTFAEGQKQRLRFNQSSPSFSNVVEGLDVDTILFQSGNTIRYTFNGSPDLSVISVNDVLFADSSTNALNDGSFFISTVDDGSNFIEVTNDLRSDDTLDEASDTSSTVKLRTVETIRLVYNGLHSISATTSTLNDTEFNAVCYLATSLLLYSLSNFMNESVNRQIDADSVDYAIKGQNYRQTARDFQDKYEQIVGLKGDIKAAQALLELDIKFSHGEDFLFHPSHRR